MHAMRCSGAQADVVGEGSAHSNMVCSCGCLQMEEPVSGEQAGPMAMGVTVPFSQVAVLWSGKSSPFAFLQPANQLAFGRVHTCS